MAAENDFEPFGIGGGALRLTAAEWAADATRLSGFGNGVADPLQANTAWSQPSIIAYIIGQFIANAGFTALDNGDLATLLQNFQNALQSAVQEYQTQPPQVSGTEGVKDTVAGLANALSLNFPGLANNPAISTSDLLAFYEEAAEGGEAAGVHRQITFGAFASAIAATVVPSIRGSAGVKNFIQGLLNTLELDYTSLPQQGTCAPQDLVALYSGGEGEHYSISFAAFAGLILAQAQTANESGQTSYFLDEPGVTSFTVPNNVYLIKQAYIYGAGGGGGGSSGNPTAGSGGGSGAMLLLANIPVQPGQVIQIGVGRAGAAGTNGGNGGMGGTSSFGSFGSCTGGGGGSNDAASGNPTPGGNGGNASGTANNTVLNLIGGPGGMAFAAGYMGFEPLGGFGAGCPSGGASCYTVPNGPGIIGNFPGAGGSGGAVGYDGGLGANGCVAFSF